MGGALLFFSTLPAFVDPAGDPTAGHRDERAEEAGRAERLARLCDPGRSRLLLRPGAGGLGSQHEHFIGMFVNVE